MWPSMRPSAFNRPTGSAMIGTPMETSASATRLLRNPCAADADAAADTMVIADIPGLLEGAHDGVGLGRAFLRHIERCQLLVHVVDGTSDDPIGDFEAVRMELQLFSPWLADKPSVVILCLQYGARRASGSSHGKRRK